MLPNSFPYLFLFLPITVGLHLVLCRAGQWKASKLWLLAASLFFYGYARPAFLAVLLASITFNYWVGGAILARPLDDLTGRRRRFQAGLAGNLAVLGAYKYLSALAALCCAGLPLPSLAVPLGISFFTFQQITYLDDCLPRREREGGPLDYALLVSFFPYLIAGPITRFRAMVVQVTDPGRLRFNAERFYEGLLLFLLGLGKKTLVADRLALWSDGGFAQAASLSLLQAWTAALSYAMQLYFDFSGYSDMAKGAAGMLSIELPWNFDSPYQAADIRDFWRRWHISLSEWIRDYVFEPLHFAWRYWGVWGQALALMVSFVAMGLWHGATWGFLFYGALHGVYMASSVLLQAPIKGLKRRLGRRTDFFARPWHVAFTFLLVTVSFVGFRAGSPQVAAQMLAGMAGRHGQPSGWLAQLEALNHSQQPGYGTTAALGALLLGSMAAAFFGPNTKVSGRLYLRPALAGLCMALLLLLSAAHMNESAGFLYFNY